MIDAQHRRFSLACMTARAASSAVRAARAAVQRIREDAGFAAIYSFFMPRGQTTRPRRVLERSCQDMKTTTLLATGALSLFAVLAPMDATADMMGGLGLWEGTGTVRAASGADLGRFNVTLTRRLAEDGKVRTDGQVTFASGQVSKFWQEVERGDSGGFQIVSSNGIGKGRCFANGICESYEYRRDRHAFATTIVRDAADRIRVLITELEKGESVRFIEQTLTKKP
jgi:hypothetical protein